MIITRGDISANGSHMAGKDFWKLLIGYDGTPRRPIFLRLLMTLCTIITPIGERSGLACISRKLIFIRTVMQFLMSEQRRKSRENWTY
jgi:hypothetical protein